MTTIRETGLEERGAILALYPLAFPEEDLTGLVAALLETGGVLSLGAYADGLAGHAIFTRCGTGALLGPVAVDPARQKAGIGSALVRGGFDRLAARGVSQVFVLGDPGYYGRFGFEAERRVTPPYPLPTEWDGAWQSVVLEDRDRVPAGPLVVPEAWRDEALWLP